MVGRFARQAAMFVIALGLLLNGAFPCSACMDIDGKAPMAAGMSMPDMSA
jgi:hypothetical protein